MISYPDDWGLLPFGEVTSSSQYGMNTPSSNTGNIPIIGMADLRNGRINTDNCSYVQSKLGEVRDYILEPGDLLINRTNSYDLVGKTSLFMLDGKFVFASYLVRFKLRSNTVDPRFISYFCNSHTGKHGMQRLATKAVGQANINPTVLKEYFRVPVPPLREQERIAEILSNWDKAIELTERLIEALKKRKKGLMQRLMTGEVRFTEFADQEWLRLKLGDVFNQRKEKGYPELPLLSVTDDGIKYRESLNRKDTSNADKSNYLRICPGDIGYNTMRMWQGRSALSTTEGIVSPAYTIITPKTFVDGRFMAYLIKFQPMVHTFWRHSQGLVSDTLSLKFPAFSKIMVELPSLKEQAMIADTLESCDSEIALLRTKLCLLSRQKRGLMQRLLTGQVRVRVD